MVGLVTLLVTFSASVWYALWSPAFSITEVAVRGASAATERDLKDIVGRQRAKTRLLVLPQANLVAFDAGAARKAIDEAFVFDTIDISKTFPHTLSIAVKEKELKVALVDGDRFLAVDGSGLVFRRLSELETGALNNLPPGIQSVAAEKMEIAAPVLANSAGSKEETTKPSAAVQVKNNPFPLVLDVSKGKNKGELPAYSPGETAFAASTVSLVLEAHARLGDVIGRMPLWFDVDERGESVKANLDGGASVYLYTGQPFGVQAERLALVLKEKIGDRKNELEYVDLRYNEKIYFKFRNETR